MNATPGLMMKGNQSKRKATEPLPMSDAAMIAAHYELENARFARLIHDGPAQKLTAAMIELSLWKGDVEQGQMPSVNAIEALGEVLRSVSTEVREVTSSLRPRALDLFGVGAVIETLANKRGNCKFRPGRESIVMDAEIAIQLVRIAQSLLSASNAATELEVELAQTDSEPAVNLTISGWVEFEIPHLATARARALGGSIERQSNSITVRLPKAKPGIR